MSNCKPTLHWTTLYTASSRHTGIAMVQPCLPIPKASRSDLMLAPIAQWVLFAHTESHDTYIPNPPEWGKEYE